MSTKYKVQNTKWRHLYTSLIDCIKRDWITSVILLFSFVLYMVVIVPSGSRFCFENNCGVYFWGAHEHDGIWHLALIESAFHTTPFRFPTFAHQLLSGYNYILDVVLYVFSGTGISASFLYFKTQPVLWFVTFALLLYRFSKTIDSDRTLFRLLAFFALLSSSFGFLILWLKHSTISGSAGTPTMQGALGMMNPQFMWSLCVILGIWLLLRSGHKRYSLMGLLIFFGVSLKFYAIIPIGVITGSHILVLLFKKNWRSAIYAITASFAALSLAYFIFYRGTDGSAAGIVWSPFALVHQIVEDRGLWYQEDMVNQRYFLIQAGNMLSPRLWWIEIKTILWFLFFNYGVRFIAVVAVPFFLLFHKQTRVLAKEFGVLLAIIILSTTASVLFIQKGIWWNTIQFLYYGLFAGSILTTLLIWSITRGKYVFVRHIIMVTCLLLFLPSHYDLLKSFANTHNIRYISEEEILALRKLRTMPDGIVLTQLFKRYETNQLPDQYDTAYVSAYSGKQTFMSDDTQLTLLGIPYEKTLKNIQEKPCELPADVSYVYIRRERADALASCMLKQPDWKRAYQNRAAEIWKRR